MSEEISIDVIKKTQKILGKHIKKPQLTDKLLNKPPFRFLLDVVKAVVKETGFLKGLFSEVELQHENVKEKDSKIAFLNKLIDAVKEITKTDLKIRASKVVAGLEPLNTNELLQSIGKAIDSKIDASEYVAALKSGQGKTIEKRQVKKDITIKEAKLKSNTKTKLIKNGKEILSKRKPSDESPKYINTPKGKADTTKGKAVTPKEASTSKKVVAKQNRNEIIEENESTNLIPPNNYELEQGSENEKRDVKNNENKNSPRLSGDLKSMHNEIYENTKATVEENTTTGVEENKSSVNRVRPKSARPKSSDRKFSQSNMSIQEVEIAKPLEITANHPIHHPRSSLRPPSVRPSSARPGAPRLRPDSALPVQENVTMGNINVIVENVDNLDDEETVIIETTSELPEESASTTDVPLENKGQLVEQILEEIKGEVWIKTKVDIDWETDVLHKEGVSKEITQLRTLIQNLTKTANPLGKLMNYLHEDIDAMHSEWKMWRNTKNHLFTEIEKLKRLNVEANKPLLNKLEQLQHYIKKQQEEIAIVHGNIIRNDIRIKELLSKT